MAGEFMSTESLRTCPGRDHSAASSVSLLGATMIIGKSIGRIGSRISRASSFRGKKAMGRASAAVSIESGVEKEDLGRQETRSSRCR